MAGNIGGKCTVRFHEKITGCLLAELNTVLLGGNIGGGLNLADSSLDGQTAKFNYILGFDCVHSVTPTR